MGRWLDVRAHMLQGLAARPLGCGRQTQVCSPARSAGTLRPVARPARGAGGILMKQATPGPIVSRCAWYAVIFATVAAGASIAEEVSGSDYSIDNGFVRSWADPFTDDYKGTILLLSGDGDTAYRIVASTVTAAIRG